MATCPNHLVGVVISVCEACYLDQDAENSRLRDRLAALTAALAELRGLFDAKPNGTVLYRWTETAAPRDMLASTLHRVDAALDAAGGA